MASTFAVLAEPARRNILDLLREQPLSVGELVERLGLTQPGTSKHLRVLRDAGLVSVRRLAQRRMYELVPDRLTEVDEWLAPYRRFWTERFDALERHLETMPDGESMAAPPGAVKAERAVKPERAVEAEQASKGERGVEAERKEPTR